VRALKSPISIISPFSLYFSIRSLSIVNHPFLMYTWSPIRTFKMCIASPILVTGTVNFNKLRQIIPEIRSERRVYLFVFSFWKRQVHSHRIQYNLRSMLILRFFGENSPRIIAASGADPAVLKTIYKCHFTSGRRNSDRILEYMCHNLWQ
jgi:hypothetical protein